MKTLISKTSLALPLAAVLLMAGCAGSMDRKEEEALNRAAGIAVSATERGVAVRLPDDVLFETGKADIREAAKRAITRSAVLVNRSDKMVSVEGHTDNVGAQEYNQSLSDRRAAVVRDALVAQGVDRSRVSTSGFSYDRPVASNETAEGRAKNRRTEIFIMDEGLEKILGK
ncbi:OmpA family protein [Cupriavidus necator]